MPLWNKDKNNPKKPDFGVDKADKRNVIATNAGWVRRQSYTDIHGKDRVKDEVLVAMRGLEVTLGVPTITSIYVANSTRWFYACC